jgi:hypothetical protein
MAESSKIDKAEAPVIVRPWFVCAVAEATGEHADQLTGWQEKARAAAADVGPALFPIRS